MAQKFNFQAVMKLNANEFKKGVNGVKSSLKELQNSIVGVAGALGLGLGLNNLLSDMKAIATELSVAENLLKNVSKETKTYTNGVQRLNVEVDTYEENLRFIKQLSKTYSQDMLNLMSSFGSFVGACKGTNLALEDQKLIFEALTKASAFYGLSAEKTKSVFNAVQQMISKGTVASEELRQQLGDALPGAMNVMANALGVTTKQLGDMLQRGEVLASEALPKFANELNKLTQGANFDNLQTSMNNLKNTWVSIISSSGAQNVLKKGVDGLNSSLRFLYENVGAIAMALVGLFAPKIFASMKSYFSQFSMNLVNVTKAIDEEFDKLLQIQKASPESFILSGPQYYKKTKEGIYSKKPIVDKHPEVAYHWNRELEVLKTYEKQQLKLLYLEKQKQILLGESTKEINQQIARQKASIASLNNINLEGGIGTQFRRVGAGIKNFGKMIGGALKSFAPALILSAVLGIVTKVFSYLQKIREESERISNLYDEYIKKFDRINAEQNQQMISARSYEAILKDEAKALNTRIDALRKLNEILKNNGVKEVDTSNLDSLDKLKNKYNEITEAVKELNRILILKAKIETYSTQIANAEAKKDELELDIERNNTKLKGKVIDEKRGIVKQVNPIKRMTLTKENELKAEEIKQLDRIIANATKKLEEFQYEALKAEGTLNSGGGGSGTTETIESIYNKYIEEQKNLRNQLKEGAKTQDEYNKAIEQLAKSTFEKVAGRGDFNIAEILKKVNNDSTLSKFEEWYYNLSQIALNSAINALMEGSIDLLGEEINDSIENTIDKLMDDLNVRINFSKLSKPTNEKRKTTFDYKKSDSEILGEEAENAKNYAERLKDWIITSRNELKQAGVNVEEINEKLKDVEAEYIKVTQRAKDFQEASDASVVLEDIKNIRKQIGEGVINGIGTTAQAMDQLVNGFKSLKETLEDQDVSGFEKLLAIINMMVQSVNAITSVISIIDTIAKLSEQLSNTENSELATKLGLMSMENEFLKKKNELLLEQQMILGKNPMISQKNEVAMAGEMMATKQLGKEQAASAVAGAGASAAKNGPMGWLLALGIIGTIGGLLMSTMNKFASGGIVGGRSTSGDKNLVRVNSGEMILNKGQQANLFRAIDNGTIGGNGQVTFKVRGQDLVGTLKNYNSKLRG